VTLTHTVGVLVLGLVLTLASSVAGEEVLRYLGVVSGLLVVVVGAVLLRDALRERRLPEATAAPPALAAAGAPAAGGASRLSDHATHGTATGTGTGTATGTGTGTGTGTATRTVTARAASAAVP
jgi:ABC-type nickel/cobalt efflux system permease component RcnA